MSHYTATVHLLFEVDESANSEATIADALNNILTCNMRKYSEPSSCLIDWSFDANGDALESVSLVTIPEDYEPDESRFPYPAADQAAPDMLAALKGALPAIDKFAIGSAAVVDAIRAAIAKAEG